MPKKHDYLYNWMEDENYKILMDSIALLEGEKYRELDRVQKALISAIENNNEADITKNLDEFSMALSGLSESLEEKGLNGLKAFVDHTRFIVEMAVENEKEKAPTQMEKGKEWLFFNGFPAPLNVIEPINKDPYSADKYNELIENLGFVGIWGALQKRIEAEKRLNAGVTTAEEAEELRDDLIEANKSFIEANEALGENIAKNENSQYVNMFEGTIDRDNKVPKMLEEQNKALNDGVFVGLLDEYEFFNGAKKDLADITRKARTLAGDLRDVKGSAHKRSKYFNDMEDAMAKVIALSPNDSTYDEVTKALDDLQKASKAYTDNRNRFQHNSARITQAERLNSFASEQLDAFKKKYNGTELSINRGCRKSLDEHIADVMLNGQEKLTQEQTKRRKIRLNDFENAAKAIVGNAEIIAADNFLLCDKREGSKSYKEFKSTLRILGGTSVDGSENSPEEIMDKINKVIKSTDTYIKEHKGLHIGDGKRRIEYAQSVNKFLKEKYNALNVAYQQLGNDRGAYSIRDIERTLDEGPAPKKKLSEIRLEKLDFINPADTEKMRKTGEDVCTKRYRDSGDLRAVRGVMYAICDEMEREMKTGKYQGDRNKESEVADIINGITRITQPYTFFVKGEEITNDNENEWEKAKQDAKRFKEFIEDEDNFATIMKVINQNTLKLSHLKPENFIWSIHKLNDVFGVGIDISELERDYYQDQLAEGKIDSADIRKVRGKAAFTDAKYKQSIQHEELNDEKEELVEEKAVEEKKPVVEEKQAAVEEKKVVEEKKSFDVAENLKAAQKQLENMKAENGDVVPEASAMAGPIAEIITSLKITTVKNDGIFKNITRQQFDAINKGSTLKDPCFDVMIKHTAPEVLYEQATKGKGQNLYQNFMHLGEKRKELSNNTNNTATFKTEIKKEKAKTP